MRKASFSVEKVSSNTDAHNSREHSPKYLLGCEEDNPNVYIKYYDYEEFQTLAENRYMEVNKQKMQTSQKEALFEEALISLEKHHTEKDIENLFKDLNKKYTGHTLINLAIHRDEGHFEKDGIEYYPTKHILQKDDGWYILDEDDTEILQSLQDKDFKPKAEDFKIKVNIEDFNKVYNYHAHAVFSRFDLELGKSARLQKKTMSERYKFVAEQMQMKYAPSENRLIKKSIGQHKTDLSATRNAKLVIKKELENEHQKEIEQLKNEIKELKNENTSLKKSNSTLKGQNTKLKKENETLKFDKKQLEEDIKNLSKNLRETLKDLGALRPQYAQLEQLNKELKEELKNELLNHEKVVKSYQDLEKNLREELTKKDEEILTLKDENKVQNLQILQLQKENELKEVEILELQNKLELAQKRSQSYFGLNKELKEEIIALKEQINSLEIKNDTLASKDIVFNEKIVSKPNMSDLDIDFDTEDLEKDDNLEKMINQMEKNTTSAKTKFLDKLNEIDKKLELVEPVEPTKNRRVRKNR